MKSKAFIPPQGASVVKASLRRLSKEQFTVHAQFYYLQMCAAAEGSKEHRYYSVIFAWCKSYYRKKWG